MVDSSTASLIVFVVLVIAVVGSVLYLLSAFSFTGSVINNTITGCKAEGKAWNYYANNKLPPFDCCTGLEACSDGFCRETCPSPPAPEMECVPGSGPCCNANGFFKPDTYVCDYDHSVDYGCPWGTACGADVGVRYKERHCSGYSSSCNGEISGWGGWSVADYCGSMERCSNNDATCNYDSSCATDGCTCGEWQNVGCGIAGCGSDRMYQIRYCSPDGCSIESRCLHVSACEEPAVTCEYNSDCGADRWIGSEYCIGNDVYLKWRVYTCHSPGTSWSYCSYHDKPKLMKDCGSMSCENGECVAADIECYHDSNCGTGRWLWDKYCFDNDVYQIFRSYTCHNPGTTWSYCSYDDDSVLREDCGSGTCQDGVCVENEITCYSDSNCGTDGWTGSPYCSGGDAYQDWKEYTCYNPGTIWSKCSVSVDSRLKEACGTDYCSAWGSEYCYDNDVYQSRTCYDRGCSSGNCFSDSYTETQKLQECGTTGCSAGACVTEPEPECTYPADCGIDGWSGSPTCYNGDVWQIYRVYNCVSGECVHTDFMQQKTECGLAGCSDGLCN